MAVILYRKGKTHTINGIDCEIKRVESCLFSGEPEQGWFLSPEEAYCENKPEKVEETAFTVEVVEEAEETTADFIKDAKIIDGMDNDEVRVAAEKAGIVNFKTARITTLKNKLKA